jgi:3-dehydrosphinganine reductase
MPRHAIISGGSSGIGAALAMRLAGAGWAVSLLARGQDRLDGARDAIRARFPQAKVQTLSADVCDGGAVEAAIAAAIGAFGAPDLVVTSAGIVVPGTFSALPPDAFRSTMETNYFGTLYVIQAALGAMRARRGGHIVLVSSGAGLLGLYGYTAYAPTKFAVRGLAEALRSELKPQGIGVSIVYPPDTDTPQLHEEIRIRPEATSRIAGGARIRSADEVAQAIIAGVERKHFVIAPGWEMGVLARLHSLIGPLLNRFSFDPIVARFHDK